MLQILQTEGISDASKNFTRMIGGTILPIVEIANNPNHFSLLAFHAIDIFANLNNLYLVKRSIVEKDFEDQYLNMLTLINNISVFIKELPGLNEITKNSYDTYLSITFHIVNNYPLGVQYLYDLVMQIYQAYLNKLDVCFNCDNCKNSEGCNNQFKRVMH